MEKRIRIPPCFQLVLGDFVLDVNETTNDADGLQQQIIRGMGVGDQVGELDAHEGDLGLEVFEGGSIFQRLLLLRREGAGVEAVFAGVLVARLSAAPARPRYGLWGSVSSAFVIGKG